MIVLNLNGISTRVFKWDSWQGCATQGSLSKEDAAFICAEALDAVPGKGFIFEVWQSYFILNKSGLGVVQ